MNYLLHPLARFCVALIFIISGAGKIFGFAQTAAMMGKLGFPMPDFFLTGAIALEIIGGLMLLFGYKTKIAALLLIIFMIPATLIFHTANLGDPAQTQLQMIQTLKNLAIIGALIKFFADGAGAFSLDNFFTQSPAQSKASSDVHLREA
jgi:putative oxidoreductase